MKDLPLTWKMSSGPKHSRQVYSDPKHFTPWSRILFIVLSSFNRYVLSPSYTRGTRNCSFSLGSEGSPCTLWGSQSSDRRETPQTHTSVAWSGGTMNQKSLREGLSVKGPFERRLAEKVMPRLLKHYFVVLAVVTLTVFGYVLFKQ